MRIGENQNSIVSFFSTKMPKIIGAMRAIYDYSSTSPNCLGFKKDDVIMVTSKDKSGWWFGSADGKSGESVVCRYH